MSESQLLQLRSFGKTSLTEVQRKLQEMGLSLGASFESNPSGSEPAQPAPAGMIQ
jgi:DNA-directed RNA polymerase alpha subunit